MTRWIKNEDGSIKSFEQFEKEEFKKSHYRKWDSFKKRHVWIEYGSEQHNRILENKPKGKKVQSPSIQVSQDIASRWYHSNEWKKVRSEHIRSVYESKGTRRCNQCGVEGKDIKMHVDHIYPVRKFWSMRLDLNNLQDLCSNCNAEKGNFVDDMIPERRLIRKNGQWVVLQVKQESFVCPDWLKDKTPFDWKEQEKPKTLKPEIIDIKKLKKVMNIQIELSKDVEYKGEKLGKYIWNLEESNNHVTGFCDTLEECFVEIMRFKNVETN